MKQVAKRKKPRSKPPSKREKTKELPKTTAIVPMPPVEKMTRDRVIAAFDALGITSKLDGQKKKELFVEIALAFNLNPLKRELHAMEISGVLVPEVGYEVYVKRAEKSQRLEYWYTDAKGEIDRKDWRASTYCVTLVVKRKDRKREQRFDAWFNECVGIREDKPNSMWAKRPKFMTWKCAVAMLRIAVPEELGEMPYMDAEYSDEMVEPAHPSIAEPRSVTVTQLTREAGKEDHIAPRNETDEIDAEYEQALNLAKSEVKSMYATMVKSGLYDMEEDEKGHKTIPSLVDAATKAGDGDNPIEALRNLLTSWQIEYAERKAKADTTDAVAEKGWK